MRVGAQWIASKEGLDDLDDPPAWVDIGFLTSEPTLLLLIAATVCAGIASRRAREGGRAFGGLNTAALVLVANHAARVRGRHLGDEHQAVLNCSNEGAPERR